MGMMKDFKDFAMKGNVLDLAVAVIIAGAFGKIITSFVKDVLMPPIGLALGDTDFTKLKYVMQEGKEAVMQGDQVMTEAVEEVAINYGMFINTLVDFIIIAFVIFLIVRAYVKSQKKNEEAAPPPGPTKDQELLMEIRDSLKK